MNLPKEKVKRWRSCFGRVKEVTIYDFWNGTIKVPGSIYCTPQPKIERWLGYYDTEEEAISATINEAQQEVENAQRVLRNANNRLKAVLKRFPSPATPKT